VWGDRRLGERTTARLQYDFSYAWVGYDAYLMENALTPALFHDFGRWGTTRLFTELSWDDYRFHPDDVPDGAPGGGPGSACPVASSCGPFGLDERDARDRDGFWLQVGFEHTFPVDALDTEFTVGYRFHDYDAEGREYSYLGHQAKLGSRTLLPWRFTLDLEGSVTWRDYRHPSTFPDPGRIRAGVEYDLPDSDKHETQYEGDAILSRPINDWLIGSLRFAYQNVQSNVDVFEYERTLVGAYLTVRYPP